MKMLVPAFESIQRAYAAWLTPPDAPAARRPQRPPQAESSYPEIQSFAPSGFADTQDPGPGAWLKIAPVDDAPLPDAIADAIDRQVAARPVLRAPQAGDLIVLPPPVDQADDEPSCPLAVLLDEQSGSRWHGWLVGAHVDYAGDRDLVLEASLIEGNTEPAPIAGMVLCWDQVSLSLASQVMVIHRLNAAALHTVRALAGGEATVDASPDPGRMCLREIGDGEIGEIQVVTGTPYLRDDPRTPYLHLARELARRISEPEYDDQGQVRRIDREGPER